VAASSIRGGTAIVGIGQTPYYRRGAAGEAESQLCLRAIVAACADAGIDPRDVDGFVSYGSDRNVGDRLMPALGTRELRLCGLVWSGGGGGIPGALGLAAGAIMTGQARVVAVYRAMAEAQGGRLRVSVSEDHTAAQYLVNGIDAPTQILALRAQRLMEGDGVPRSALRALSRASYYHAARNPRAQGRTIDLTDEVYDASRMISEPLRLFDCSRENDAAIAVILVAADRAKDVAKKPAYLLSAPLGAHERWGQVEENHYPYTSGGFRGVAKRLWAESGYGPADVDVAQIYTNFTAAAVAAIIDHGFCTAETAGAFLTFENLIAPSGRFPINTSGGDLAEGFLHGMGSVVEAVRQIRGESPNQVPGAKLSLMTGGPMSEIVSSALFGGEETL
jgi:acetyl-CoA acetyltransferase